MTLALALVQACHDLTLSSDHVIALEVANPAPRVEAGDTLRLVAQPLNAAGQPVTAAVAWAVLDTGTIPFQLSASGLVTANTPGTGRVQASADKLRSDPITVTVTSIPDTVAVSGGTRVTVAATEMQSAGLAVTVFARTPVTGTLTGIAGKNVIYQVVQPPSGNTGFFLTVSDTVPGLNPRKVTAVTAPGGLATAKVRRITGQTPPDSVILDATIATAHGVTVPGSPVRFVVVFGP